MDIGAAGALSLFNYQMAIKGANASAPTARTAQGSQSTATGSDAAVLQALSAAYTSTMSNSELFGNTDPMSSLAGSSGYLKQLVNGIHSASVANGNTSLAGLDSTQATIGGESASSARDLLSGMGPGSMDSFSASILSASRTLAMAAYSNVPNHILSTSASSPTASVQATSNSSLLNLLG